MPTSLCRLFNKRSSISNRHRAREAALQILFQSAFDDGLKADAAISHFQERFQLAPETLVYVKQLVQGVLESREELDKTISDASQHWTLERMAFVDLTLLRIACFEITSPNSDVPPKVAIDEAVELAKQYGTTESSAFVNGLLDEVAKLQVRV